MTCNQVRIAADGGNVAKHQVESKLIPIVCPEGKVLDRRDVGCSCLLAVVVSMLSKNHRNMRFVVKALQLSWATMRGPQVNIARAGPNLRMYLSPV